MRNSFIALLVVATTTLGSTAFAEDAASSYDVKFEEIGQNCSAPPVALGRGKVAIATRKTSVIVNIETIPEMVGKSQKGGKVNAKTLKGAVPTTVQGLDAKYSIAGTVSEDGVVQLVLVAEYSKHDDKKPYCTQSWNVTGLRSKPEKPEKK
jgi:hypothetical protein